MHILILNGPNLNMLGIREPEIYGEATYEDLQQLIKDYAAKNNISCQIEQSNSEGILVDYIQAALGRSDAIIINPAAYTHTSIALLDALKAVNLPTVEVHISDPDKRESFRKISYLRAACLATIKGKGFDGYLQAMDLLIEHLTK